MANLLVVEDDSALLAGMNAILGMQGHRVLTAHSGEAALETLSEHTPELIISDIIMAGISGTEFYDIVQAHPRWSEIPFVFVSASTTDEIERKIAGSNEVSFLRKPFEVDALVAFVEDKLRHQMPVASPS